MVILQQKSKSKKTGSGAVNKVRIWSGKSSYRVRMQGKKENVGTFFRKDVSLAEYMGGKGKLINFEHKKK